MLRGLYAAASGMIAEQRRHDAITDNIANINTPGFKERDVVTRSFPEMLVSLMNGGGNAPVAPRIGRLNTGVLAEESISYFKQGDLEETKNPADLALSSDLQVPGVNFDASGKAIGPDGNYIYQPQVFFTLRNGAGEERYTRDGKFYIDDNDFLVASNGMNVLDANGNPISLTQSMDSVRLTAGGQLVDASTGQALTDVGGNPIALRLSKLSNPNDLIREGDGTFRLSPGGAPAQALTAADAARTQVKQGYLERSNVDAAASMVDMLAAQRAYEANQRVIQYYDRSMDKAVNDVGKV